MRILKLVGLIALITLTPRVSMSDVALRTLERTPAGTDSEFVAAGDSHGDTAVVDDGRAHPTTTEHGNDTGKTRWGKVRRLMLVQRRDEEVSLRNGGTGCLFSVSTLRCGAGGGAPPWPGRPADQMAS